MEIKTDEMHNDVRKYYNEHVENEDSRLDNQPFEIPVLMNFVNRYLKKGDRLYDLACGTGRIAGALLDRGFLMGLNDLSDKNIELVRQRTGDHPGVLFIKRADALESNAWDHGDWDGILLLGPMYHLTSIENRQRMLRLAYDHLKPGGYLFSAFMTRVGALVYGLKNNPEGILYADGAEKLWETGTDDSFVEATEWFTNAYFSHPEEIKPLIEQSGLKPLHLAGVEGVFGERLELYHQLDKKLQERWMGFIIGHCEDPRMIQNTKHLLSVAQKPALQDNSF
ncbi:MAG: class I SAM-dependent methyltransferase [Bacteroidota bacterium]